MTSYLRSSAASSLQPLPLLPARPRGRGRRGQDYANGHIPFTIFIFLPSSSSRARLRGRLGGKGDSVSVDERVPLAGCNLPFRHRAGQIGTQLMVGRIRWKRIKFEDHKREIHSINNRSSKLYSHRLFLPPALARGRRRMKMTGRNQG